MIKTLIKRQKLLLFLSLLCGGLGLALLFHLQPRFLFPNASSPTMPSTALAGRCPDQMVWVAGGDFAMGSDDFYPEEKAVDDVRVTGFCIDTHEVTNAQFAKFVADTNYRTVAERPLSAEEYPQLSAAQRQPGSLVFQMPESPNQPVPELSWWHWTPGSNWQHPQGPASDLKGREQYPVVHIALEDAQAYAQWANKQLPTESQWEYAARGGLQGASFTWGNEYKPTLANSWQGLFPLFNTAEDGHVGLAPVESYPPNSYGLYDMAGNVWEWTLDWYQPGHGGKAHQTNPTGPLAKDSYDSREPGVAKHVIKGGSYLCAPNYCSRFRPGAREAQSPDTGTSHIGFRLVQQPEADPSLGLLPGSSG